MNRKILKYCIFVSIFLNIILGTYVANREPVCDRVHLDTISHTKDVIRYGKTAVEIADIYIESYQKEDLYYLGEKLSYDVLVSYDEWENEWVVDYNPILPYGVYMLDCDRWVRIRSDYGTVTAYGWGRKRGLIFYL